MELIKTFNLDNYFTNIAENDYFSYINFLKERRVFIERLFKEIQNELDTKEDKRLFVNNIKINLSWYSYKYVHVEGVLEAIPLSFSQDPFNNVGYIINVDLGDLKNIEKYYNEIIQEKIPLKEDYIRKRKEQLFSEYNNPIQI